MPQVREDLVDHWVCRFSCCLWTETLNSAQGKAAEGSRICVWIIAADILQEEKDCLERKEHFFELLWGSGGSQILGLGLRSGL